MSATNRLRGLWNMTRFYMAQKKAARAVKKAEAEKAKYHPYKCLQRGCQFAATTAPDTCPVCNNPFREAQQ